MVALERAILYLFQKNSKRLQQHLQKTLTEAGDSVWDSADLRFGAGLPFLPLEIPRLKACLDS